MTLAQPRQHPALRQFPYAVPLFLLSMLMGGTVTAEESANSVSVVVPLAELIFAEADRETMEDWRMEHSRDTVVGITVVTGSGRAWLAEPLGDNDDPRTALPAGQPEQPRWRSRTGDWSRSVIVVTSPDPAQVAIRLDLPVSPWAHRRTEAMVAVTATLPTELAAADPQVIAAVRQRHYARLAASRVPGSRWFSTLADLPFTEQAGEGTQWQRPNDLQGSLQLFSGARAVSENLALDRPLLAAGSIADEAATDPIALDALPSMEQAAIDWQRLQPDAPERGPDVLAAALPADQHALFFPDFAALIKAHGLITDSVGEMSASLGLVGGDSMLQRYQQQLALPLDGLAQRLGGLLISEVAITGGDLSLDLGSEMAVLLRSSQAPALAQALAGQAAALAQVPAEQQRFAQLTVTSIVNAQRGVSSYQAQLADDLVVVANHPRQLQRIAAVLAGQVADLAHDHDYRALRQRHAGTGDEVLFVILSDAAIRRWCNPGQRLAEARRIRAHAGLSDLQARQALGRFDQERAALLAKRLGLDWGSLSLVENEVHSERYGSLKQLTPATVVAEELAQEGVSPAEAEAYRRWHAAYVRGFRQWFDPIALQLSVDSGGDAQMGLSVLPLHASSDFHDVLDTVGEALIASDAPAAHPQAIVQWTLAIDPEAPTIANAERDISSLIPGLRANPLAWLGGSASLFIDQDPLWAELAASSNSMQMMSDSWHRLPAALQLDVRDSMQLTLFLTALRGFAESSAPGLVEWTTAEHADISYVQIVSREENWTGMSISYAALPEGFWISPNQQVIERVLERVAAQRAGQALTPAPWGGATAGMYLSADLSDLLPLWSSAGQVSPAQRAAWAMLPLLNDLRHHFSDDHPAQRYRQIFGRALPEAAHYVWDPELHSMVSSVYGHPLQPKALAKPLPLGPWAQIAAGLNLDRLGDEALGLRVRLDLTRQAAETVDE